MLKKKFTRFYKSIIYDRENAELTNSEEGARIAELLS